MTETTSSIFMIISSAFIILYCVEKKNIERGKPEFAIKVWIKLNTA